MRFFISQPIAQDASRITLDDAEILHQIKNVLRKKQGSEIILLDNSGYEYLCIISAIGKTVLELEVMEKKLNKNEPANHIALYQSIIKKDKMEWVFEKCTEIGVSEFIPVLAEHSVKLGLNAERGRKIIKEAAEQSRRGKIPMLSDVVLLSDALSRAAGKKGALNIVAHNTGIFPHITDALVRHAGKPVNIIIGPEGGLSVAEVSLAQAHDFIFVSLGTTTLRSETAAVAASLFAVHQITGYAGK